MRTANAYAQADRCLCYLLSRMYKTLVCYMQTSMFWLVSEVDLTGLSLTWSEIQKGQFSNESSIMEPEHSKMYSSVSAPSEHSDQPAHPL